MKKYFLFFMISTILYSLKASEYDSIKCKECPAPLKHRNEYIVEHTAYKVSYNYTTKIANWVAYELTMQETLKVVERNHKFVADPDIPNFTIVTTDYSHSGFDRGHLAPAADMAFSKQAMKESFYLSNVVPQNPNHNRGVWKKLEELSRSWAKKEGVIWIVNIPILDSIYSTLSSKNIAIPTYLCKIIVAQKGKSFKGIAFVIKNEATVGELKLFVKTIDEVEKITGIDFFYQYPQNIQKIFESQVNLNDWDWN